MHKCESTQPQVQPLLNRRVFVKSSVHNTPPLVRHDHVDELLEAVRGWAEGGQLAARASGKQRPALPAAEGPAYLTRPSPSARTGPSAGPLPARVVPCVCVCVIGTPVDSQRVSSAISFRAVPP